MSSAAYKLPLRVGKIPDAYKLVGRVLPDGSIYNQSPILDNIQPQEQYGLVYFSETEKTLIVAYRGTDDLTDVFKDCDIRAVPYKCVMDYGKVHEGFQAVYFAIRDSVIQLCKQYRSLYDRLVLTGHSLGAALSELSAPDLLYQHMDIVPEIVNFAAPRVAAVDFATNFNKDISHCFRLVNKWDTIPKMPSEWTGFRHVGQAIEMDCGRTINALHAHSLDGSYRIGLRRIIDNAL